MQSTTPFVFLSYARSDKDAAMRLYSSLSNAGINAWIDAENLLPGQNWQKAIRETIEHSSHFIALLSKNSIEKRGYVQSEIRHAIKVLSEIPEDSIFLIPARLDECTVPYEDLRSLHWVDLFPSFEQGAQKIVRAIKATLSNDATTVRRARDIASLVALFDVTNVGGGAHAYILPDSVVLSDDRMERYSQLDRNWDTLPLAEILANPTPSEIASMWGTACAFSFHLVLSAGAPWAIVRPPYVVVNSFEPVPKHKPVYPLPAQRAHIYYVEMDNPETCGLNEFPSKYIVHVREESEDYGSRFHFEMAELTTIRLIPDVPEYFVVRVNALTPGVYDFGVYVDIRIGDIVKRLTVREGCKYLFVP
jgi:hypothetical protein